MRSKHLLGSIGNIFFFKGLKPPTSWSWYLGWKTSHTHTHIGRRGCLFFRGEWWAPQIAVTVVKSGLQTTLNFRKIAFMVLKLYIDIHTMWIYVIYVLIYIYFDVCTYLNTFVFSYVSSPRMVWLINFTCPFTHIGGTSGVIRRGFLNDTIQVAGMLRDQERWKFHLNSCIKWYV